MKFYAAHARTFDFESEWYSPLREIGTELGIEFVFPHENSDCPKNSKNDIKMYDGVIAEVSHPSTGLGIELGWADALGVPIILVHRANATVSSAVLSLTEHIVDYSSLEEFTTRLSQKIRLVSGGKYEQPAENR